MLKRNYIYFFFNNVCCTESLWQRFVLFVTLSHCDKLNFCWSQWVTATNKNWYMLHKKCQILSKIKKKHQKGIKMPKKKGTKSAKKWEEEKKYKKTALFTLFSIFFRTFTHFVCHRDKKNNKKCNKKKIIKNSNFFVPFDKKKIKKKIQNKFHHRYQIALEYLLSNGVCYLKWCFPFFMVKKGFKSSNRVKIAFFFGGGGDKKKINFPPPPPQVRITSSKYQDYSGGRGGRVMKLSSLIFCFCLSHLHLCTEQLI